MTVRKRHRVRTSARGSGAASKAVLAALVVSLQVLPRAVQAQNVTTGDGGNVTSVSFTTSPTGSPTLPQLGELDICGGLDCQQNSTCQVGDSSSVYETTIDTTVGFHTVTNQNGFSCACPPGWAGLDCRRPYQTCPATSTFPGDDDQVKHCFHGGTCLPENEVEDADFAAYCECSNAFLDGQRYAGKYCEVAVDPQDYCDQGVDDVFCLNGGSCPTEGDSSLVCACREGYFGAHCEFLSKNGPACTLECFNEGTCRFGRLDSAWGNRDDFYCSCLDGYSGVQCEHRVRVCADGETICLHGATCTTSVTVMGQTQYVCECPEPYLGGSGCRGQERMELCNPQLAPEYTFGMALPAFCLNGGTCKDVVNRDATVDFGCDCPHLFEGPHCELLRPANAIGDIDDLLNPKDTDRSAAGAVAGSVAACTLAFVAAFFVVRQVRRNRKSRRREDDVILNLQSFREENFGAISANGSMLFPGVAPPPSTIMDPGGSNFTAGELLHEVDIT